MNASVPEPQSCGQQVDSHRGPPFCVSEALAAELERRGLSCEALAAMALREGRLLAARPGLGPRALPRAARAAALGFLAATSSKPGLAALLLDAYCARAQADVNLLPLTCLALASLLGKFDDSQDVLSPEGMREKMALQFLDRELRRLGHKPLAIREELVHEMERELLRILEWRLDVPTVDSWLRFFIGRFGVFCQDRLCPTLEWIWETSTGLRHALVAHEPLGPDSSPRQMATGLFGILLARAGLLPHAELRPQPRGACAEPPGPLGPAGGSPCLLKPEQAEAMLARLAAATQTSLCALQESSLATARVLAASLGELGHPSSLSGTK